MFGKTKFAKDIIAKLQDESTKPTLLMLLVEFGDEWKKADSNSDNTVYVKKGNRLQIYDKSKQDAEVLFQKMLKEAQSSDNKRYYKVIYWDDSSQDNKNYSKNLLKLLTCGRHFNADLIISNHRLTNLFAPMRQHVKDYLLGGPQSEQALKKLYQSDFAQYFYRPTGEDDVDDDGNSLNGESGYDWPQFWEDVETFLNPYDEDPETRKKTIHRFIQIHLPTPMDPTPQIVFIEPDKQKEQVITTNALWKL